MSVRVRFAPSPTGPLHIGGVRTALFNWMFARAHGGTFILRIEDTDRERLVPQAEQHIIESLRWCGLTWDEGPLRQSERTELYRKWAQELVHRGKAYYAFDTPEQLERMRQQQLKYDAYYRTNYGENSLRLPASEVERRLREGVPYVIRILVPQRGEVRFYDIVHGWVTFHVNELDDKVLLKSDGYPTYHLANVVDDHEMRITHVIRGEEWIPSTPIHVLLYEALQWQPPRFAHLPLILRPDGKGKLSKRDAELMGFSVFAVQWQDTPGFRELGFLPSALLNILALMGWSPPTQQQVFRVEEVAEQFRLEDVGKRGCIFDFQKALWINMQHLRQLAAPTLRRHFQPFAAEKSITPDRIPDAILLQLAENAHTLRELANTLASILNVPFPPATNIPERGFLEEVYSLLQTTRTEQWNGEEIATLIKQKAKESNLSIGKAFKALRLSLTGKGEGPPIGVILTLLGRNETLARLHQALTPATQPHNKD